MLSNVRRVSHLTTTSLKHVTGTARESTVCPKYQECSHFPWWNCRHPGDDIAPSPSWVRPRVVIYRYGLQHATIGDAPEHANGITRTYTSILLAEPRPRFIPQRRGEAYFPLKNPNAGGGGYFTYQPCANGVHDALKRRAEVLSTHPHPSYVPQLMGVGRGDHCSVAIDQNDKYHPRGRVTILLSLETWRNQGTNFRMGLLQCCGDVLYIFARAIH